MPQAVQSLPYVAWVLLVALSFGSFAFVVLTRQLTDATSGYVRFTAFCSGLLALLALVVDRGLPVPTDLAIVPSVPSTFRDESLTLFALTAFLYAIALRFRRSPAVGPLGLAWAVGTLFIAAFGWAPTAVDAVPLLVQLVMLSLATGGSLAAVILGHWYLVTPKISEKPLVLQARLLL